MVGVKHYTSKGVRYIPTLGEGGKVERRKGGRGKGEKGEGAKHYTSKGVRYISRYLRSGDNSWE